MRTASPQAMAIVKSTAPALEKHGVELASVGRTGGDAIEVAGQLSVPVADLKAAWQATLPAVLGAHLA